MRAKKDSKRLINVRKIPRPEPQLELFENRTTNRFSYCSANEYRFQIDKLRRIETLRCTSAVTVRCLEWWHSRSFFLSLSIAAGKFLIIRFGRPHPYATPWPAIHCAVIVLCDIIWRAIQIAKLFQWEERTRNGPTKLSNARERHTKLSATAEMFAKFWPWIFPGNGIIGAEVASPYIVKYSC